MSTGAGRPTTGVRDGRLFRESLAARRQIALTVLFAGVSAGLILAQAGLLADIIVRVSTGRPPAATAGGALALLAVVLLRGAVAGVAETSALHAATVVKSELRSRLLGHVLRLGPGWQDGRRTGELTVLSTRGLDALDPYFARFLPTVVLAVIVPPVVLLRIGIADWLSAVVLAVTVPLIPTFLALIGWTTRERTRRQWRLVAELGGFFLDVVEGLPTLKAFRRSKAQESAVTRVSDELRRSTMSTLRIAFTSALVLELLATLGTALVAVAVGLRLVDGSVSYHTALLVLLLAPEVYLPIRAFGAQFHASAEGAAAAQQVFDVLDVPLLTPATSPTAPRATARWAGPMPDLRRVPIRLHEVSLRYPDRDRPALDRLDLTLPPGHRTVLVGPSGAGKSSVLALLLRFLPPSGGDIRVGSRRLEDLPVEAWREQIAWVSQAPHLFAGTLADNVRLGRPEATDGEVERALERAEAAEFVAALPAGPRTRIEHRGLRLSTGQRQRIALARAFLRDPPLLLLDEPTAHLDPIAAAAIRTAVERLMADRTVLLVTHQAAWLAGADTVVTLRSGRPVGPMNEVAS